MSIYETFLENKDRPIHKNLHYFPIYERHFSRFVNTPLLFLEIGSGGGGSSLMWRKYFGSLAKIVSIDIRPECKAFEDEQISIRIGDQADPLFLQSLIDEFGTPDIVLDDGSHQMEHVSKTFDYLYPRVYRGGVYAVEDMHTSYWEEYGGGLGRPGTFIERCKTMIDDLNSDYFRPPVEQSGFSKTTISMHFYDSVVVFERGQSVSKKSVVTGDPNQKYG